MGKGIVNERQAETLKRLIEAGQPGAGTSVAGPGGAEVTIDGLLKSPGLAGTIPDELRLSENGPFLRRYLKGPL
jgi:hypothetical protein